MLPTMADETSPMVEPPQLEGEALGAVQHRGSHLQIIAAAGTGKTEVVAQRVTELFVEGVAPGAIVAFTFTERAAESLRSRIEQRVSHRLGREFLDHLNGCFIGTIHAYCFQLLQEHVANYETYDVLDENRLAAFITRFSNELGIGALDPQGRLFSAIKIFTRNLDVVNNELIAPDRLNDPFRGMVERLHSLLTEHRFLTYGQQIALTVSELERPEIFAKVHAQLRHLIVDEYQDVNPAQERLIQLLSRDPVELCVVADDDQAIYQWRGSDVGNTLTFAGRYLGVSQFRIEENRRSRPPIIEVANRFVSSVPSRLAKSMSPTRTTVGTHLTMWQAPTEVEEADRIARTIVQLHKQGHRYSDVAILVRGSVAYSRLLEALDAHHVPAQPAGRTGLFKRPEAQLFGRTCAFLAGLEWREQSWGRGSTDTPESLTAAYRRRFGLSAAETEPVRSHLVWWQTGAQAGSQPANLVRDYYNLLRYCGVADWDLSNPVQVARLGTLARCSAVLSDYEIVRRRARPDAAAHGEQQGGRDRGPGYFFWLAVHVQNWAAGAYEDFEGEDDVMIDAVDLTTVHKAKGLEWPIVFIPSATERRFPSSMTGRAGTWHLPGTCFSSARYEGSDADERRLFYVAMTRARDWLSISCHLAVNTQAIRPSPYLSEASRGDLPDLEALPLPPSPSAMGIEDTPLLDLTFSDVAVYAECGYAYRLRILLGFQPTLAPELGYGKAVHHVLRSVAEHAQVLGEPPSPKQLDLLFDSGFYLPAANKSAHRNLRAAARRLVDNYLAEFGGDLWRVRYLERPFQLHLPLAIIGGRADVIIREGEDGKRETLAIVDYKTSTDADDDHALQLQVYTDAGRREGMDVTAAYVHDLKAGTRTPVPVAPDDIDRAELRVISLVERLRERIFDASPGLVCRRCDVSPICRFAMPGAIQGREGSSGA